MFEQEFSELPGDVRLHLEARLEEVIGHIVSRYGLAKRDYTVRNYTSEEIGGMIFAIFDLARRMRPEKLLETKDE